MDIIDLHTHTNFSDGTSTPEELMDCAAKIGLRAIALTDHDTVAGVDRAQAAAAQHNIEFITGVEMSASYEHDEIHILGIFVDHKRPSFLNALLKMEKRRRTRNLEIIDIFKKSGMDMDFSSLLEPGKIITRAHFAKLLVENNYAKDYSHAFKEYLSPGCKAYRKRELFDFEEAVNVIVSAGGIASLAHPAEYDLKTKELEKMIYRLKKLGLTAIEAYHSASNKSQERLYIDLAKRFNLKITGGSDFHGKNKPRLELGTGYGNLRIPYNLLTELKKAVNQDV